MSTLARKDPPCPQAMLGGISQTSQEATYLVLSPLEPGQTAQATCRLGSISCITPRLKSREGYTSSSYQTISTSRLYSIKQLTQEEVAVAIREGPLVQSST
jgi:hypothetical protein